MQLTERDCAIIRLVHRHRFLRSPQIVSLVGDSRQQILRRLQLLYHHGYLERPRAQIDYYHQGGAHHIVHGLGNKGAAILKRKFGIPFHRLERSKKNQSVGRIFLEHALLVADVMVAIELACRESGHIRLVTGEELKLPGKLGARRQPFRWKVKVSNRVKIGVIPDRVFALDVQGPDDTSNRLFFFLEADRGTMPITRRDLAQTSFYRKLLAYEATWSQSLHRTFFGFNRFRVLTVTTNPKRVESLVSACSRLKRGHGLFLFADQIVLAKPGSLFSAIWHTGKPGETGSMLR